MTTTTANHIDPRTTDVSRRGFLAGAAGLTLALTVAPDPLAFVGTRPRMCRCRWVTITPDGTMDHRGALSRSRASATDQIGIEIPSRHAA